MPSLEGIGKIASALNINLKDLIPNKKFTSVKILRPNEESDDDTVSLICDAKGRDFETMSNILEEATIINAVTGNPMVRTFVLCKLIILSFFSSWNLKDAETGNVVPITSENIGKTRHEIVRALAQEWLKITSGK
jgi:hypothetical protein